MDIKENKETKELKQKGRKAGQIKDVGYIIIDKDIRIRIEEDNLIIQERTSLFDKENNKEDEFGKNHYYTSWDGVLKWLIRHYTTEKISKKKEWLFKDAKKEIIDTMGETINIIMRGINSADSKSIDKLKKFVKE